MVSCVPDHDVGVGHGLRRCRERLEVGPAQVGLSGEALTVVGLPGVLAQDPEVADAVARGHAVVRSPQDLVGLADATLRTRQRR
jgi:hypothetical protein